MARARSCVGQKKNGGSKDPPIPPTAYCLLIRSVSRGLLVRPRATQDVEQRVVALVTSVFVVAVVVVPLQWVLNRPRLRPCLRVVDAHLVQDHVGTHSREPLGDRDIAAVPRTTAIDADTGREAADILRLDNERVAVPVTARVTHPH